MKLFYGRLSHFGLFSLSISSAAIDYTIETDWYKREKGVPTRLQFVDKGTRTSVREGSLQLEATIQKCIVAEAHIDVRLY